MCFPDPHTLNGAIAGFYAHFVGLTNETYERYVFNNRNQGATESVEDYVAALRTLSKACNFCECTQDSLLRDRIVLGITDNATSKRPLQELALTLTSCIDLCRCAQVASSQIRSVGDDEATAHAVTSHSPGGKPEPKTHTMATRGRTPRRIAESNTHDKTLGQRGCARKCKFCNRTHVMKKELCPAYGKICDAMQGPQSFPMLHTMLQDCT